MPAEIQQQGQ